MEIKDKRLLDKMNVVEREKYLKDIYKSIPDADDKYDELEVTHEEINLLQKIKNKNISLQETQVASEIKTEEE